MEQYVDYEKCLSELVKPGGTKIQAILDEWEGREGYAHVRAFVKEFVHRKLFLLGKDQIAAAAEEEHALGEVKKEEQIRAVEDFTCPFSWNDAFHAYIESKGAAPSFPQFRRWLTSERPEFVWNDLVRAFPVKEERYRRAIRWRIGKVYYSLIRELYILTALRQDYGISLNYHLIADVRLRVDFWLGKRLIVLYFPNRVYRAGGQGRKLNPTDKFPKNYFEIITLEVPRQGFGHAWLARKATLDGIAAQLQ